MPFLRSGIRAAFIGATAISGTVAMAQEASGPGIGYAIDGGGYVRPLRGIPAAAHYGERMEAATAASGELALLRDGTALRSGTRLAGTWAALEQGVFLSADRKRLLAGDGEAVWELTVPSAAISARVSGSGGWTAVVDASEGLTVWGRDGAPRFRVDASRWWSVDFAGTDLVAYDPAEHTVIRFDAYGNTTKKYALPGEAGRFALTVLDKAFLLTEQDGRRAILLPHPEGEARELTLPVAAHEPFPIAGRQALLLHSNASGPLWVLDPTDSNLFVVIPAATESGK